MAYNVQMIIKNLLVLCSVCMLVACGWVDSTGRESNSAPVAQISFADGPRTGASVMNELDSLELTVNATDADGEVSRYEWQPEPVEQGALTQCAEVADFEIRLAVNSLKEACTPTADCEVTFEQQQQDVGANEAIINRDVVFQVESPELRAPVGVTYKLETIDNDGGVGTQLSTFCLVAINEAPDAEDDVYTVLEGQTLTVPSALSPLNLLSNDEQDDHVSNTDLRVLTEPAREPLLPVSFSLNSDGGFTYVAPILSAQSAQSVADTFVYSVTDGTHVSEATVTINIVATNDAPVQDEEIPLQKIVAGVEFETDLSDYFTDPEGGSLSFALSGGVLPASGAVSLSSAGVLSGTAGQIDVGSYIIEIIATDGSAQTRAELTIDVVANRQVKAVSIPIQQNELGEVLGLDLSDFFTDPEDAPLIYTVSNVRGATFDLGAKTGLLEATFTDVGSYLVSVSASDGVTIPSNIRFLVIVSSDNVAPVFRGSIVPSTARVGVAITPIDTSINFFDANGDVLEYSVDGTLPDGIMLSAAGVLFGVPTENGTFPDISLVATDPLGETARSNIFRYRVFRPLNAPTNTSLRVDDN